MAGGSGAGRRVVQSSDFIEVKFRNREATGALIFDSVQATLSGVPGFHRSCPVCAGFQPRQLEILPMPRFAITLSTNSKKLHGQNNNISTVQ